MITLDALVLVMLYLFCSIIIGAFVAVAIAMIITPFVLLYKWWTSTRD